MTRPSLRQRGLTRHLTVKRTGGEGSRCWHVIADLLLDRKMLVPEILFVETSPADRV
jgi:hypothetical protein